MNARERAIEAVLHKEVFPVPTDVFENGISPVLERALSDHFGLQPTGQLAPGDRDQVLEALGACCRWAHPFYVGPVLEEDQSIPVAYPHRKATRSIWGTWDGPESYTDELQRPLASAEHVSDVDAHHWPDPDWFDYDRVGVPYLQPDAGEDVSHWARRKSDYLRIAGGWSPVASRVFDLFGMQVGLTHLAERRDLIDAAIAQISAFYIQYYSRLAKSTREYVDVIGFGDDFSSQRSMLFSPDAWRTHFLPLWKALFAIVHEQGLRTMMHSCGAIRAILPDLIDAGLDILEVVQLSAKGMDADELKREFGRDLVFYGGMDVQGLMPYGTPSDVRREARRLIEVLGKGGGYIFATSHFMGDDVSVENALAMYREGASYTPLRAG